MASKTTWYRYEETRLGIVCDTTRSHSEVWVNDPTSEDKGEIAKFGNPRDAKAHAKMLGERLMGWGYVVELIK